MKKNKSEKSLEVIKANHIWTKIKQFFNSFFVKEKKNNYDSIQLSDIEVENNIQKDKFIENIKNIEDEEIKLLKLQQQYRSGEIKEEELTEMQMKSLCDLYDKQIQNLQKSNENRRERIKKLKAL